MREQTYTSTETNLCDGMGDSEVFDLSEYGVFRRDRETTSCAVNKKSGCGVIIGVRRPFNAIRRDEFQS